MPNNALQSVTNNLRDYYFLAKISPCNQAGADRICTGKARQARSFVSESCTVSAGLISKDFFS